MITQEQYDYCKRVLEKYIPETDLDDCLQETLLIICEMDTSNIKDICKYIIRSVYTNYKSNTSPYARKYKQKMYNRMIDIDQIEDDVPEEDVGDDIFSMIDILAEIDSFDGACWWEKEAVKRKVLENKTFRELAVEYNISESQIQYSFYKTIKKLKKYILQKYG